MTGATLADPGLAGGPRGQTGRLFEIVDGEQQEVAPMGALAGIFATLLAQSLNAFAIPHKLGLAVIEVLFDFGAGRPSRRPDVALVRYDRWPPATDLEADPPAWRAVPNLAVEVVSPNNTADEIEGRLQEYFDAGVELVWVVHPLRRRVYVYESLTRVRVLLEGDELDGGTVLPGYRQRIADLFATMAPPA